MPASLRDDELRAQDAFDRFLRTRGHDPKWAPGADPPDLELSLGSEHYPVEVTTIMAATSAGNETRPERGWVLGLVAVTRFVREELRRRGALTGVLALHLEPVQQPMRLAKRLLADVEAYAKNAASTPTAPKHALWTGEDGATWTIQKVGDATDYVGAAITVDGVKWQGQVRDELGLLISEVAATKSWAGDNRTILLLIDGYSYAEEAEWAEAANIQTLQRFHTVARVFGDAECQILFSHDSTWVTLPAN